DDEHRPEEPGTRGCPDRHEEGVHQREHEQMRAEVVLLLPPPDGLVPQALTLLPLFGLLHRHDGLLRIAFDSILRRGRTHRPGRMARRVRAGQPEGAAPGVGLSDGAGGEGMSLPNCWATRWRCTVRLPVTGDCWIRS